MKKGTSHVMWLLIVITFAILVVFLVLFLAGGKSREFTGVADKISSGTWGDIFGAGKDKGISSDKNIVKWIASESKEVCESDDDIEKSNKHHFSQHTRGLYTEPYGDAYNITWKGEKNLEELRFSKTIEDCSAVQTQGLSTVSKNKKYRFKLEPGQEDDSVLISAREMEEDNILPTAEFRIMRIGTEIIDPDEERIDNLPKKPTIIEFTGAPSSGNDDSIVEYRWTLPDGEKRDGKNIEVSFDKEGKKVITLKVFDEGGGTSQIKREFFVGFEKDKMHAQFAKVSGKIEEGNKLTLRSQSSPEEDIEELVWSWEQTVDGETKEFEERGQEVDITLHSWENFEVTLTAKGAGEQQDSYRKILHVKPEPKFNFSTKLLDKGKWEATFEEARNMEALKWKFEGDFEYAETVSDSSSVTKTFNKEGGRVNLTVRDDEGDKNFKVSDLEVAKFIGVNVTNVLRHFVAKNTKNSRTALEVTVKNMYEETSVRDLYAWIEIENTENENIYNSNGYRIILLSGKTSSREKFEEDEKSDLPSASGSDSELTLYFDEFHEVNQENVPPLEFRIELRGKAEGDSFNQVFCAYCESVSCEIHRNYKIDNMGDPDCIFN